MTKFENLREKYNCFIYKDFMVERQEQGFQITYFFSIPGLCDFEPKWVFPCAGEIDEDILNKLVFNLGMAEVISYWKCVCPPILEVQCGEMSLEQKLFWNKLFYNGLGEFLYRNNIDVTQEKLVHIKCRGNDNIPIKDKKDYKGCMVPVGGGKDSVVTLELLSQEDITTFSINGNKTINNIINLCRHKKGKYSAQRVMDSRLLEMNAKGYLNGHTPFSAVVAFSSVISAFLCGIKYVVLSNETSANEATVKHSNVNHQYSKSFEFEKDFVWYIKSLVDFDVHYFSLLRPLTEIQIAWLFSRQKIYHKDFRSCNVGSKKGIWCCNCPKCLFVYIILLPFLSSEDLISIFGKNLLNCESLEKEFRELIGLEENKPFECVGTRKEVLVALKYFIEKGGHSILSDRYKKLIIEEQGILQDMLNEWVDENNVPEEFCKVIKGYIGQ